MALPPEASACKNWRSFNAATTDSVGETRFRDSKPTSELSRRDRPAFDVVCHRRYADARFVHCSCTGVHAGRLLAFGAPKDTLTVLVPVVAKLAEACANPIAEVLQRGG